MPSGATMARLVRPVPQRLAIDAVDEVGRMPYGSPLRGRPGRKRWGRDLPRSNARDSWVREEPRSSIQYRGLHG